MRPGPVHVVAGDRQRGLAQSVRLLRRQLAPGVLGGGHQVGERLAPQLGRQGPVAASLPRGPVRGVVVVGEELRVLAPPFAGGLLQPSGHGGVGGHAFPPGQALIRHVPGQHVLEGELRLAGDRGRQPGQHQVPFLQVAETRVESGRLAIQQATDRARPEHAAHHRGALQGVLLGRGQQVDAGGQHGLDRVGDDDVADVLRGAPPVSGPDDPALVDEVTDDLLQEERVPFRAFQDPSVDRLRQVLHRQQEPHQPIGVGGGEGLEPDR